MKPVKKNPAIIAIGLSDAMDERKVKVTETVDLGSGFSWVIHNEMDGFLHKLVFVDGPWAVATDWMGYQQPAVLELKGAKYVVVTECWTGTLYEKAGTVYKLTEVVNIPGVVVDA